MTFGLYIMTLLAAATILRLGTGRSWWSSTKLALKIAVLSALCGLGLFIVIGTTTYLTSAIIAFIEDNY